MTVPSPCSIQILHKTFMYITQSANNNHRLWTASILPFMYQHHHRHHEKGKLNFPPAFCLSLMCIIHPTLLCTLYSKTACGASVLFCSHHHQHHWPSSIQTAVEAASLLFYWISYTTVHKGWAFMLLSCAVKLYFVQIFFCLHRLLNSTAKRYQSK